MTLLSYQVFQTVVGQGSFQKAAEILNLTPSAVSHAIASMEQELGFSLFTRNKAGVALTNYGEHLLPYVNAVLNSDESLQQAIAGLNGLKMGNVKVGCFSSVCTNWMTDIIHSFHQRYPDINIELYQGNLCGRVLLDQKRHCRHRFSVPVLCGRLANRATVPRSSALRCSKRLSQTGRYSIHDTR